MEKLEKLVVGVGILASLVCGGCYEKFGDPNNPMGLYYELGPYPHRVKFMPKDPGK